MIFKGLHDLEEQIDSQTKVARHVKRMRLIDEEIEEKHRAVLKANGLGEEKS